MTLKAKQMVVGSLGAVFLLSLVLVQWREVARKAEESGRAPRHVAVPAESKACVDCHAQGNPGIIEHWKGSTHAEKGVGCVECHRAEEADADAFRHYGAVIASVVTPRDCSRCHPAEGEQFARSHHAKGGNILASLDNYLAENVEGHRGFFNPHAPTPGRGDVKEVQGFASVALGCKQCHGSRVGILATDGATLTVSDFRPGPDGRPTDAAAVGRIARDENGKPRFDTTTWPNTGIGRINLDGSLGSCSACHSRHDFSPRRARQPENCGKCHLGPDHPQKEIYEESKHGVAYRDMKEHMNLDAKEWVLGKDYTAAPTCASCHMSGNVRNGGKVTHDPGERISWTNRPPISQVMDTDLEHRVVTETDPEKRKALVADTWQKKRERMQDACASCHTPDYVRSFYRQYDDLVVLYNEKFARPGAAIVKALRDAKLLTPTDFDEEVEWTWYYLWHHEGRRARHGASMMAPDYTHWHGMFEVAERWYMEFVPQVREILAHAREAGNAAAADAVSKVFDEILSRPEHRWMTEGPTKAPPAPAGGPK
jgi:hypothetical protein